MRSSQFKPNRKAFSSPPPTGKTPIRKNPAGKAPARKKPAGKASGSPSQKPSNRRRVKIILASRSLSRRQQLKSLGFHFTIRPHGVDEDFYKRQSLPFPEMCLAIARAKVNAIAQKHPTALVLGGDQMAVLGQRIFNKAHTVPRAVQSLKALEGKTHTLLTACCMRWGKKSFEHVEINIMRMRKLSGAQIRKYVQTARPLECAGSYALERCGIGLFEQIKTADQTAIIGFPLTALINQLIKWKIPLPFL